MPTSISKLRQKGDGKIGCIFWTAVLVLFGWIAWQVVPVKMKSVDLEQFMMRQAERAGISSRASTERLRNSILQQADELDLPLDPEALTVTRSGARVRINAAYTVQIDLIVTKYDWTIEHKVDRAVISI